MIKAMIFAAGLGTRMRHLTENNPKALVMVSGKPLLEWVILHLKKFGINEIIINVHYQATMVKDFLKNNNNFGCKIYISDERDLLLETGGGLKKAKHFFDSNNPFLVCNTDILCDIDIENLYQQHLKNQSIATLAVQKRATSRYFLFDEKMQLSGWCNVKSGEVKLSRNDSNRLEMLAFSSFQILSPRVFDYMPSDKDVFSTVDLFLQIAEKETINGYVHNATWLDVGTPENIAAAEAFVKNL
jgi:NDP-sugar pyrophosphorylase family protein